MVCSATVCGFSERGSRAAIARSHSTRRSSASGAIQSLARSGQPAGEGALKGGWPSSRKVPANIRCLISSKPVARRVETTSS